MSAVLSRVGPPQQLLARLRWSFLLFILFFVVTFVPQLTLGSVRPLGQQLVAVAALAGLGAWYVRCYRAGRFPLPGLLLEVVAFVLVVITPEDPYRALGLLYIAVNFRALYGSWRHVLAFTALALASFAGSVVLVAQIGGPDRVSLLAQSLPGVPVLAVIAHLVAVACERGERAAARERVLSRSGTAIALASGRSEVLREALLAVTALTAGVGGVTAVLSRATPSLQAGPSGLRGEPDRPTGHRQGSLLSLPLLAQGSAIGVLDISSPVPLPVEMRDSLEALASQVAMGLRSARLVADLRHRATHDTLTGVGNRSVLQERLDAVLPTRGARDVVLLLLDLDGFKAVNDTRGHRAGDEVLQAAARRMGDVVGPDDLVVRLGGDEFVVLLDRPGSTDAAQRMVPLLDDALARPVTLFDGSTVSVGASIGTAVALPDTVPHDLLGAADAAMYAVKSARRDVPPVPRTRAGADDGPLSSQPALPQDAPLPLR